MRSNLFVFSNQFLEFSKGSKNIKKISKRLNFLANLIRPQAHNGVKKSYFNNNEDSQYSYEQKYLKYKEKYLKLRGGIPDIYEYNYLLPNLKTLPMLELFKYLSILLT